MEEKNVNNLELTNQETEEEESFEKDSALARDYLLGRLSSEARQGVADRYFIDDAFFNLILLTENDLTLEYVKGELFESDRESFARYLEIKPDGQAKLAFAKALLSLQGIEIEK